MQIKKKINFENYKETLFSEKQMRIEMNKFSNKEHIMYVETINKIALCAKDDKRIIKNDKINTFAFYHEDLKNNKI